MRAGVLGPAIGRAGAPGVRVRGVDGARDGTEPVDAGAGAPLPAQGNPSPFRAPVVTTGRRRLPFPLLGQLHEYRSLRPDLVAGVMIAALAIPQAMAYAQLAGLPVVVGLYGLVLPLVAYSLLGSSRTLMTGPTTTAALMVGPVLVAVSPDPNAHLALAAMLALLVGGVFLLGRLLRLGWVSDYFSAAVLLGFVTGLALTLIAGQLGVLLGVSVTGETPLRQYGSFLSSVLGGHTRRPSSSA